ncbi:hypothetical protein BGZ99_005882 [Dissophora globulifera]|uniref:F-box domain-containing protein n=1 Tax=Dissophora globulifera TaxID=979702 RepID=A0A9P6RX81_9FUNG|nr:hypothetical protein BGZ99_005882 [Dissophora globulifera]
MASCQRALVGAIPVISSPRGLYLLGDGKCIDNNDDGSCDYTEDTMMTTATTTSAAASDLEDTLQDILGHDGHDEGERQQEQHQQLLKRRSYHHHHQTISSKSINDRLSPEILLVVFEQLAQTQLHRHHHHHQHRQQISATASSSSSSSSHHHHLSTPRSLVRCMLVCRSWYDLLGPRVWKAPRLLWSQHWSRFYPIPAYGATSSLSSSPVSIATIGSRRGNDSDSDDDDHPLHERDATEAHVDEQADVDLFDLDNRNTDFLPAEVQLELLSRRDLKAVLATAGGTGQLIHRLDRQELEEWLQWKEMQRARRIRSHKKRQHKIRRRSAREGGSAARAQVQQVQRQQPQPQQWAQGQSAGLVEGESPSRRRRSTGHSGSRNTGGQTATPTSLGQEELADTEEDNDNEDGVDGESTLVEEEEGSEDDDDDDEDEDEPHNDGMTDDDSDLQSDYNDASDDETPLMKLVSGFDYLHSILKGPSSPTSSSASSLSSSPTSSSLSQSPSSHVSSSSQGFFFAEAMARIRRQQAAKRTRRRLAEMRCMDGLPASLPLESCGRWIQVINLQQETPLPQKTNPQLLTHHASVAAPAPPPAPAAPAIATTTANANNTTTGAGAAPGLAIATAAAGPAAATTTSTTAAPSLNLPGQRRSSLGLQPRLRRQHLHVQRHAQQQQQQDQSSPQGFLASIFSAFARPHHGPGAIAAAAAAAALAADDGEAGFEILESGRLRSRRQFVTDKTLQSIMQYCPGLCKLTISECHGISDMGMRLIRDSMAVQRGTLVSLHMAGCWQITDQGLLNLVGTSVSSSSSSSSRHGAMGAMASPSPARFESLDLAGCYQISDAGLIPLLKQCGTRLRQLRLSDCENVSANAVMATLAEHCPYIQWLDLARSGGVLTEDCLVQLADRCTDLEWLNLARINPNEPQLVDMDADGVAIDVDELASMNGQQQQQQQQQRSSEDSSDANDDAALKEEEPISDRSIALLCESCPKLQLLDLSYIHTISNAAIESLSQSAKALVCLTIIGCPGITSQSLAYLAKLRNTSGKLGCITMGDALGISEKDIEQIMQGTLSGWQKSLVDETNLGDILGRSWDE